MRPGSSRDITKKYDTFTRIMDANVRRRTSAVNAARISGAPASELSRLQRLSVEGQADPTSTLSKEQKRIYDKIVLSYEAALTVDNKAIEAGQDPAKAPPHTLTTPHYDMAAMRRNGVDDVVAADYLDIAKQASPSAPWDALASNFRHTVGNATADFHTAPDGFIPLNKTAYQLSRTPDFRGKISLRAKDLGWRPTSKAPPEPTTPAPPPAVLPSGQIVQGEKTQALEAEATALQEQLMSGTSTPDQRDAAQARINDIIKELEVLAELGVTQ
jgi:hypothetical protein